MKVDQKVRTNNEWNESFKPEGITGVVVRVVDIGPFVANRNHLILIDGAEEAYSQVWFNPFDLERIDG